MSLAPPLPPPAPDVPVSFADVPTVGTEMWERMREERELAAWRAEPNIEPGAEPGETQEQVDMKIADTLKQLLGRQIPDPAPEPAEELPLNPHPPGSPEYDGFEAILAQDRGEAAPLAEDNEQAISEPA